MKKILLFIFVFSFFIINVNATKLVSLGDSIPNGYLLKNKDNSYDNKIAKTLNFDFYEHTYPGMTSKNLLDELSDDKIAEEVASADIIFVNIGANDLLDVADYIDFDGLDIYINHDVDTKFEINEEELKNTIANLDSLIKTQMEDKVYEALTNFQNNFPLIIARIKELNKDAKIYVNNFYNPYFDIKIPLMDIDFSPISNYLDEKVQAFNKVYEENTGYVLMDMYNLLRNNKYLNINIALGSFDPHPNIAGHKQIYNYYLKELAYKVTYDDNEYYVLKGGKLDIKPKEKKGYTFKKWNYNINKINKDITLKAIYKKKINYYAYGILVIGLLLVGLIIKKGRK